MDEEALTGKPGLRAAMERAVKRLHVGLGHASGPDLVRILKNGGASEEAINIARTLECPICAAHKRPVPARNSRAPESPAFCRTDLLLAC